MTPRHQLRSLAAAALLALGVACGGAGDGSSSAVRGASGARPPASLSGQTQTVIPSPLPQGQGPEAITRRGAAPAPSSVAPPPAPDLGTQRPQAPPSTVGLDTLHQQGRTHVLR